MSDEKAATAEAVVDEKVTTKAKTKATGNLIHDVAVEIENLTKTKALNQAEKLAEDIETNYFRLGGVLSIIQTQQWYEGFPTFEAFLAEKFGFGKRKADYLIQIYKDLVDKQIPWEKVAHLGWTKLKDLSGTLTLENLDEWVEKASKVTVMELQALLKAGKTTGESTSASTTSDSVTLKYKLHTDQADAVQNAVAKAKGELATDFDNVALAGICTGYLANASGVQAPAGADLDLVAVFKDLGYEKVLEAFDKAFPLIDMSIDVVKHEESLAQNS